MKLTKLLTSMAVFGGIAFMGATSASAQDWRDVYHDRNDIRQDSYHVNAMEQHIAADRARMNEDIRCGRSEAAARDAADLARDQRSLQASRRDLRYDGRDLRTDYRDWR